MGKDRPMKRLLNLTGRTFLLIAVSLGLTLAIAQSTGTICSSPWSTALVGLALSVGLSFSIAGLRAASWKDLRNAVFESERTGKFTPNFPVNSALPEVNRLAAALNGAARSILLSQEDLDRAYLQFVETMAQALDARDPYTAGHSLRVAVYSHALAEEMGLSSGECDTIRIAAQLHDIGKIGIPDEVLQKPGRLTPEEYGLIKLHPQIGRRILEKVGRFEGLLTVVELHHENHDGTGYPYGIAGNMVPMEARIVHVADAFDAMTTTRSYRSALNLPAAIQEIERNIGGQFDPAVARAFLRLIAEGSIEIGGLDVMREETVLNGVSECYREN
jgi:putative nucleotidyltransferase with HDIG domain